MLPVGDELDRVLPEGDRLYAPNIERLYAPNIERFTLMHKNHDEIAYLGFKRCFKRVRKTYRSPYISSFIVTYIKSCLPRAAFSKGSGEEYSYIEKVLTDLLYITCKMIVVMKFNLALNMMLPIIF